MTRQAAREPVSLSVARALDERLHVTLDDHFGLGESRLYGCCIVSPDVGHRPVPEAFRYSFLGAAPSVYELLEGSYAVLARAFDAACVVTTGWGAPLDRHADCGDCCSLDDGCGPWCTHPGRSAHATRPSEHPDRFRLVICTVVSDEGLCSVVRDSRQPDEPVEMLERGEGMLPDALESMWFGDAPGR